MNTRIQELAEQAESYAYSAVVGGSECQEAFIKKFAELIVGECISKCDGNGEYKNHTDTEFGQGVAAGITIAKAQIQTHFGVDSCD